MKRNSKEFEELRAAFESGIAKSSIRGRLDREPRDGQKGWYYQDGNINAAFEMFMSGYQHAKSLARLGALELSE